MYDIVQFLQDWMLAVVVLIMVIVDLLVLVVFTAVVGGLNLPLVERVTHRENPQSVEGVSRPIFHTATEPTWLAI